MPWDIKKSKDLSSNILNYILFTLYSYWNACATAREQLVEHFRNLDQEQVPLPTKLSPWVQSVFKDFLFYEEIELYSGKYSFNLKQDKSTVNQFTLFLYSVSHQIFWFSPKLLASVNVLPHLSIPVQSGTIFCWLSVVFIKGSQLMIVGYSSQGNFPKLHSHLRHSTPCGILWLAQYKVFNWTFQYGCCLLCSLYCLPLMFPRGPYGCLPTRTSI